SWQQMTAFALWRLAANRSYFCFFGEVIRTVRLCRLELSRPMVVLVRYILALAFLPRACQLGARGWRSMALPLKVPSLGPVVVRAFTFVTPTDICSSWL